LEQKAAKGAKRGEAKTVGLLNFAIFAIFCSNPPCLVERNAVRLARKQRQS
jgi:hypothetical protein